MWSINDIQLKEAIIMFFCYSEKTGENCPQKPLFGSLCCKFLIHKLANLLKTTSLQRFYFKWTTQENASTSN